MARNQGSVRMGPLGLFMLVAVICMATLCVLCVTTAQASLQMSERYAQSNQMAYENEEAAQTWLAYVSQMPEPSAEDLERANVLAQAAAQEDVTAIRARLLSPARAISDLGLGAAVNPDDFVTAVQARFKARAGNVLDVILVMREDGTYQVLEWNATTTLPETRPVERLWAG